METQKNEEQNDHDVLIEVRSELRALRSEIIELKKTVRESSTDHEGRIRALEKEVDNFKGRYAILGVMASIVVTLLTIWFSKHI